MVHLKTKCDNCFHSKVCINKNNVKHFYEKMCNKNYSDSPNDYYDLETMAKHCDVKIEFSCTSHCDKRNVIEL